MNWMELYFQELPWGVFGLHFHFLFSFSENCFHFQNIWILKHVGFDFLLKIIFLRFLFSTEKYFHWKRDFIVSIFWFGWKNIFTENVFKNPIKYISITIFCFQWEWKQETTKPNTSLLMEPYFFIGVIKCF